MMSERLFSMAQKATSLKMGKSWLLAVTFQVSRSRLIAINSKRMCIRDSMSYSDGFIPGFGKGASLNPRLRQKYIRTT